MSRENLLGKELGNYRLEAMLGEGGMARVYLGVDKFTKQLAAVKVIDASFRDETDYRARFEREAEAVSRMRHPHIVKLQCFGEAGGIIYIAMQYVQGTDLASILGLCRSAGTDILLGDVCRLAYEIGSALDHAHQQGIIHRDVKPANILIDENGRAVLTDFGLALLTDVGTRGEIFGTPFYIAPEQAISSAGAIPQSDQYSLGVILYEILTGRAPFNAGNPLDTAILHITQPPPVPRSFNPSISPQVEAVILKALEKKHGDRYRNCLDLAIALETARQAAPTVEARPALSLAEYANKATIAMPTVAARVPRKAEIAQALVAPTIPSAATAARKSDGARRLLGWLFFLALLAGVGVFVWWWFYG